MTISPCPWSHAGEQHLLGVQKTASGYRVVCSCCGARGPHGDSEADAVDRWNRYKENA